jgi:hypothetical protein
MQDAIYLLKYSYGDPDCSTLHDHPDCNGDGITGVTGALQDAIYLVKHANGVSGYETLYPGVALTLSSAARINDTHINVTLSDAANATTLGGEDGGFISIAAGVNVTYNATDANGTITDTAGNDLATDATGVVVAEWEAPTFTVTAVSPTTGSTAKVGDEVVVNVTAGGSETGLTACRLRICRSRSRCL